MVGIDITSVPRFRSVMARYPAAEERFFTDAERLHCLSRPDPVVHFAGTFAAKEAVVKALGLGPIRSWARRIEITRDDGGAPSARVLDPSRDEPVTLSISHDANAAVAVAIRTTSVRPPAPAPPRARLLGERGRRHRDVPGTGGGRNAAPNEDLQRFLGVRRRDPVLFRAPRLTTFSEAGRGSDFP